MEMASGPRTVEEIFKDYSARRTALVRALTQDVDEFYGLCDPDKENLWLYGHPNETWEVTQPAEEVPPELPEPALGINFARVGMDRRDWLSLVAVHSDSWLLSVAFCLGAHLNRNERKCLFSLINDLPTVFEVVADRKPSKDKPTVDSGSKSRESTKTPNSYNFFNWADKKEISEIATTAPEVAQSSFALDLLHEESRRKIMKLKKKLVAERRKSSWLVMALVVSWTMAFIAVMYCINEGVCGSEV